MEFLLSLGLIFSLVQDPESMNPVELEKAIDKAITDGAEWLKKQQKEDGSFGDSSGPTYGGGGNAYHNRPGIAALSLMALLKSEIPPNDPVITKGFNFIYKYTSNTGNMISNYDMGVILMAIETLYESAVKWRLKKKGKKIKERPGDFKEPKYKLAGRDRKLVGNLLKKLYASQTKQGGWRYGAGFSIVGSDEDISATQIMMLGFKSAVRMRVGVDLRSVKRAIDFVVRSQEKDGPKMKRPNDAIPGDRTTYVSLGEDRARGWAYEKKSANPEELRTSGSMTSAGITSLLIGKSILGKRIGKKERAKIDQCVWDGFAWLVSHWTMNANPEVDRSHYYYLYGVERVAALGMYEKIGKHYWYKEGAVVLLRQQAGDGHWDTRKEVAPSDINDTCFALLFLRRGTVPIGDVMTGRGGGK